MDSSNTGSPSNQNQLQLVASNSNNEENSEYNSLPLGYKFKPREKELLGFLQDKVRNKNVEDLKIIVNLDVYKYEPQDLKDMYEHLGYFQFSEDKMYFFSPVKRKDNSKKKSDRRVIQDGIEKGYWKASTAKKGLSSKTMTFGSRASLVYNSSCKIEKKSGEKSKCNWLMLEYILPDNEYSDDDQKNATALCVVYYHDMNSRAA